MPVARPGERAMELVLPGQLEVFSSATKSAGLSSNAVTFNCIKVCIVDGKSFCLYQCVLVEILSETEQDEYTM